MTPEQRLEAFRKIVERSPDDPFARYSLAMGNRGAGRLEEAVLGFEELARRVPGVRRHVPHVGPDPGDAGPGERGRRRSTIEASGSAREAGNGHALSELTQAREALG